MENVSRYARLIKCKVIQLDRNTCCIFYGLATAQRSVKMSVPRQSV
ncbi:unnamed protein product [Tenebrio molitor]|nr:unnamed protein product [Tenebrio molitor]